MKKIVIFGATGNLGMYFVDYCMEKIDSEQYEIICVGRKNKVWFEKNNIKFYQVDIRNEEDFEKLPKTDIYAVVNMAGLLPAYTRDDNPFAYLDTNVVGGLRVLEYARKTGADRILYTQTWAEMAGYWGKEEVLSPKMERKLKYDGDHAFYSITKSMIVDTMKYYKCQFGLKDFVFRLPNIYLYSPEKKYYVDGVEKYIGYRYMIDRAISGENMELGGNPNAFKDIVYVKDFCQMMYKALFANVDGGTYNVGTGKKTTLKEQIQGIIDVFGNGNEIVMCTDKPSFTSFVMDISNAREELGYNPEYSYIEYLEDYKKEMKMNRFW